ncbi:type I polyketide synthase [Streptomyces sp. 5-6(2022)]|uniref:type I polyketide synthase n=1 Tax=Streptomyces sp. 5-6(2022) TaxID=2936510 RepID=UPI0023BA19CB|nr:type I polyketide synthase [Streptomyces sp. 5-6(2022)]
MPDPEPQSFYPQFPTLVHAVRWWSEQTPDRAAVAFLADGDHETERLTYADLDREAQRTAAGLRQELRRGDRAMLCFPSGLDFVVAFLGCLYAGVIAVPVYAPRTERDLGRLMVIASDSGAKAALTTEDAMEKVLRNAPASLRDLPWRTVDGIRSSATAWPPPRVEPGDIAFLQYTSGSTSRPKGVVLSHENLAADIRMMGLGFGTHPGTRVASWLPVHHDMGLIASLLMSLWQGLFTVLMPPAAFVQKPVRWLRAVSDYRATVVMSPNFGYELCCLQTDPDDVARLDLSSLELALNGAEPIRPQTLERFSRTFAPAGFRRSAFFPGYGLAEATVFASGHHLSTSAGIWIDKAAFEHGRVLTAAAGHPAARQVVSCGNPATGQRVAIVRPDTRRQCSADEVGEIWLAGPHIARGYWDNPDASAEVFGATLPTDPGTTYLRTGDLGFLRDGQLYVAGRLKDLIIVFGRNHYPQDIETTVEAHPAIRTGYSVAFAVTADGEEGLGIVAEVARDHLHGDLTAVAEAITEAVWAEHEVSVLELVLLRPKGLPKTTSGKLQRRRTQDLLRRDELPEVYHWPERRAERQDERQTGRRPEPGDAAAAAVGNSGHAGEGHGAPSDSPLARRLAALPAADAERELRELVTREVGAVLGRPPGALVEPDRPLREIGLDSLRGARLRAGLAAAVGARLPETLVFDHPTVEGLAGQLGVRLGVSAGESTTTAPVPAHPDAEPIAIVSMSCRFPGEATTPEALWALLLDGRDAVSAFPDNRGWDSPADGRPYAGGVLRDADQFDPAFFGISPREAVAIDPQQRLLLELAWETLERAAIPPASLRGSASGVFVGLYDNDYGPGWRDADAVPAPLKGYLSTGRLTSAASGRVAYTLGLEGPAISVDTACSSSLVALHLAAQALRRGECPLALAGGVTVMATPSAFDEPSPAGERAPDGRCKPFSAEADGTGWSEGAGMVLLERLSDARRNGHPVLAVLRGSAVNQDGASQGLTAPNGPSQQRLIRQALATARLSPADIDAIEAHSTGTPLGDPIEAQALLATYGAAHTPDRPLWLGSLKSNLGHTQAAAGIGGVIKMVLALRNGLLPATLHAAQPSPHVDWSAGTVRLLNEAVAWEGDGTPRRAAVSAFGLSGTNAHVILEEAPPEPGAVAAEPQSPPAPSPLPVPLSVPLPVPLSGRSEAALRAQAKRLHAHLEAHPRPSLADLAYSLATTRSHFEHRIVLVDRDLAALRDQLRAVAAGDPAPRAVSGRRDVTGKVVFVFPGHQASWPGTALPLWDSSPVFRERLRACERAFAPYVDWSLTDVAKGAEGAPDPDDADVTEHMLFAVMVALAALWRSMGVEPDAVVGHGPGEIAAAHVAGALSLEDAARIVALRGRTLRRLAGQGALATVELPENDLRTHLARFGGRLSLAGVNGPTSTLVSGAVDDLTALLRDLTDAGAAVRTEPIPFAPHSSQVDTIEDELTTALADLAPRESEVAFYSTVTGTRLHTGGLDAHYWYRNLRQPVRFADAATSLMADGHRFFVEAGPHPVLVAPLRETAEPVGAPTLVVGSLRRDGGDLADLELALGALHCRGLDVDWDARFAAHRPRRTDLPTYAFQRERFWLEAPRPGDADVTSAGLETADHPLLAAVVPLADTDTLALTGRISLSDHPWLADHTVFDQVIVPATAFVELALTAAHHTGLERVEELTLEKPLPLPADGAAVTLQVVVGAPDDHGRRSVTVHTRPAGAAPGVAWTRHAAGRLGPARPAPVGDLRIWPPEGAVPVPVEGLYKSLSDLGLSYGPAFQGLRAAWQRGPELFAEAVLPGDAAPDASRFGLHPALLDAALHTAALHTAHSDAPVRLPVSWAGVSLLAVGATTLRIHLERRPGEETVALRFADATGAAVGAVEALTTAPASARRLHGELARTGHGRLLRMDWAAPQGASTAALPANVAVIGPALPDGPVKGRHHTDLAALTRTLDQGPAPDLLVVPCHTDPDDRAGGDPVAATHAATARVLTLLRDWIADDRLRACRLALLTRRTVATDPDDAIEDLTGAALAGLVRSARAEHPDRDVILIDTDDTEASRQALPTALLSPEPQVALRAGRQLVPRMRPVPTGAVARHHTADADPTTRALPRLDPDGTVLITGGTGTLGARLARHLVRNHAARHLLLTSRPETTADGARELRDELAAAGATVAVVACDVADRIAVENLLATIPDGRPLTAVVHAAEASDDGVLTALTPERLSWALRATADAAWHLHDLTRTHTLSAFILCSSTTGVLGTAGQASHAAAGTFLNALAQQRRAQGLPALALDWEPWEQRRRLTPGTNDGTDRPRAARPGTLAPTTEEGLTLFDAALDRPETVLALAHLDPAALGAHPHQLPPMLRHLGRTAVPRRTATNTPDAPTVQRRLHALSAAEGQQFLLDLVRAEAATVLGLASPRAIEADQPLGTTGLDSLSGLELKNRLSTAVGLALPLTVIRNRDTVADVARAIFEKSLIHMASRSNEPDPAPEDAADVADGAYEQEAL